MHLQWWSLMKSSYNVAPQIDAILKAEKPSKIKRLERQRCHYPLLERDALNIRGTLAHFLAQYFSNYINPHCAVTE